MKENTITVYEPNSRSKVGFFKSWILMVKNIIEFRELIYQLFKRDFFMSYKKSFIGFSWVVLSPILGIISWVLMNAAGILQPGDVGIPYPAYVLLSSSIWGLFMGFYSSSATTLSSGIGLVTQVKFPHEVLLFKQTAQYLANFIITFIINIFVLIIFGVLPSWCIVFFPFVVLPLFFLGVGVGLIISVVSVVASDIQKTFDFLMGLVIYITPVIFSNMVNNPILQKVIDWNPLTYLIGGARDIIIYGKINHFESYLYASAIAFFVFLFSWRLFYLSEDKVIEKII